MDWLLLGFLALVALMFICSTIFAVIIGGLFLIDYLEDRRSCRERAGSDQGA